LEFLRLAVAENRDSPPQILACLGPVIHSIPRGGSGEKTVDTAES
jgi:hypothetical protein